MEQTVEQEWTDLKDTLHIAAAEDLGKQRKNHKKNILKIWKHKLEMAIREKQRTYNCLQASRTPGSKTQYKKKRNKAG